MKKLTSAIAIAIAFISKPLLANTDTLYLDAKSAIASKEKAIYYRIIKDSENHNFLICDYFMNGSIYCSGHYTNRQAVIKQGSFVYYDSSGSIVCKGNYTRGFKDGEWVYNANNSKKLESKHIYHFPDKSYYVFEYDTANNKLHLEGRMDEYGKRSGLWKEYFYYSDELKLLSNYASGIKQGEQIEYYKGGSIKRREKYEGYKLVHSELYDDKGSKMKYYPAYEYPKSPEPLKKYLSLRVKCFEAALKRQNIVYQLKVHADGHISDIMLLSEMPDECKQKMIDCLRNMKKWEPYKRENIAYDFLLIGTLKYYTPKE